MRTLLCSGLSLGASPQVVVYQFEFFLTIISELQNKQKASAADVRMCNGDIVSWQKATGGAQKTKTKPKTKAQVDRRQSCAL